MSTSHCSITSKIISQPINHLLDSTDHGVKRFAKHHLATRILAFGVSFTQALDLGKNLAYLSGKSIVILADKAGLHIVSANRIASWSLKGHLKSAGKCTAGILFGSAVSVLSPSCFVPVCFTKTHSLLNDPIDLDQKYTFDNHLKTFYINLDRDGAKRNELAEHLNNIGVESIGRIPAVYGRNLTDEALRQCLDLENNSTISIENLIERMPGSTRGNRQARIGCYLSHLAALKQAKEEDIAKALILEDDVIFPQTARGTEAFDAAMQEIEGQKWDLLFLGFAHRRAPSRLTPHLDKVKAGVETHAYVVNGQSFDRIIELLKTPLLDDTMPLFPCDELLSKHFEMGDLNALSMHPLIGFQKDGLESTIATNAKSDSKPLKAVGMRVYGHLLAGPLSALGLPRWKIRYKFEDLKPNQPYTIN